MRCATIAIALIGALAGTPAAAECTVPSGPVRARLVELYTSEGCSSCPPADRWLRTLTPADDLAVLAFHVDYWDRLGWTDRFADSRYTQRQSELAVRGGSHTLYTPEVALDGREFRRWSRGLPKTAPEASQLALELRIEPGADLRLTLTARAVGATAGDTLRAYFAVTESGLASDVRAGENRGEQLQHDHVVRAFAGPLALEDAIATLPMPADLRPGRARVVAFVQDRDSGAVAQVVQRPLGDCRG